MPHNTGIRRAGKRCQLARLERAERRGKACEDVGFGLNRYCAGLTLSH